MAGPAAVRDNDPGFTGPVQAESPGLREKVGIYHWGGKSAKGVREGVQHIVDLHGTIARVAISPLMDVDYHRGGGCIAGFSLPGALDDDDLRSALAEPGLRVIMATVYDGISYRDCSTHPYFNPGFYTEETTARIVNEYSEFTYRLHVLFQSTGKRFILSNWEGDNALYCGQAWTFANSESFRSQCLASYPAVYGGNRGPGESVEGMVAWLKARYAGVVQGRERASAEGLTGVEVLVAPEMSAVRMLREKGLPSVLYDVVPRVPFDFLSYSSYESICSAQPLQALRADLDTIAAVSGSRQIILGEIGFPRSVLGANQVGTIQRVTATATAWGVPYVIQWNLYDQDESNDYGLFDLNGEITELGSYYQRAFQPEQPQ